MLDRRRRKQPKMYQNIFHVGCAVSFGIYHQFGILWRTKIEQKTDSIFVRVDFTEKNVKDPDGIDLSVLVVHNICMKHGEHIKTQYVGLTSNLVKRKELISIRRNRMQSSFKKHFQVIVYRKLSG